jgi:two-component system, OmpR family, phosphate regulon sensor histidine kinase PhoR
MDDGVLMSQKRLIWQIYPGCLLVTLAGMIAVTVYCSHCFRQVYHDQVRDEMNRLAGFAADEIRLALKTPDTAPTGVRPGDPSSDLDRLCKQLGRIGAGHMRLTIITPAGAVLGDSDEDPAKMENHSDRPEIQGALQTGSGSSVRFSPTLGRRMMYVAVALPAAPLPVEQQTSPNALESRVPVVIVRAAAPVTEIDHVLHGIYVNMLWAGLVIAAGAAALSLLISRRISQPIVAIKQIAERFAAGELDLRVPTPHSAELAALAGSLNTMAAQLGERITTITEQRNELDAVLSSMAEGVFAVDNKGRIVSMNPAAGRLLGIDPGPLQRTPAQVEEIVRNVDLQEFVRQTLAGIQPNETDISLPVNGNRSFSLQGACLKDARGRRNGAVIVLNDLTRLRRLEEVRRDFVANVSHELKTPVTSIQGFVEALVDGDIRDPAQVERYLGIIARHTSRLNAIIDDLLTLSRLEDAGQRRALSFDTCAIKKTLAEAIDLSSVKADEKRMTIDLICDDRLEARINPPLLEQAVINLIDNAVKYSPEGSRIRVQASRDDSRVSIAVIDEGSGIPPEHLSRIFERFYVVDKSRSRKLGGTGLGLAIVKHIAQAHGGRVTVESTPGKGSTFTIHLPV